jgi:ABC-2 type transport system ATP-binding protein
VAARELLSGRLGVRLVEQPEAGVRDGNGVLVVRVQIATLDELVARLVTAGIAVRELAPVVSPLEAAFLALTQQDGAGR